MTTLIILGAAAVAAIVNLLFRLADVFAFRSEEMRLVGIFIEAGLADNPANRDRVRMFLLVDLPAFQNILPEKGLLDPAITSLLAVILTANPVEMSDESADFVRVHGFLNQQRNASMFQDKLWAGFLSDLSSVSRVTAALLQPSRQGRSAFAGKILSMLSLESQSKATSAQAG